MKLKQLMWRAANATYANAFEYLTNIPPRHWSKAFFKSGSKCDTLVNNMSEAFNSVIVNARSKPVITNMEEIRLYMMERWQKNREKYQGMKMVFCLILRKGLRKNHLIPRTGL